MKVLFVVERPTQFEAPFFRHAAADPEHRFDVLFTRPDPGRAVHDAELGRSVSWGIDLTSGYSWAAPKPGDRPALWTARQVRHRRPDLLLVNGYTRREYLAAAMAARTAGIPAALRTDSVLFPGEKKPGATRRFLVSVLQARLFHLFFTTGTLGQRYLESCGVPHARIGRFPYAVDVDHFRTASALSLESWRQRREALGISHEARVVLSLAKFSDREAPWDLLRALGKLGDDDAMLVLAGDGPERTALEELAAETGRGRILFPGYVPYTELPALYGVSDLFVHPAAEERWGVSVAEAMAAGLPVVASSRVGAAYDLVRPGENGDIYQAGNAANLAAALEAALALDRKAVAEVNRSLLATQDYPSTWQSLIDSAQDLASRG